MIKKILSLIILFICSNLIALNFIKDSTSKKECVKEKNYYYGIRPYYEEIKDKQKSILPKKDENIHPKGIEVIYTKPIIRW